MEVIRLLPLIVDEVLVDLVVENLVDIFAQQYPPVLVEYDVVVLRILVDVLVDEVALLRGHVVEKHLHGNFDVHLLVDDHGHLVVDVEALSLQDGHRDLEAKKGHVGALVDLQAIFVVENKQHLVLGHVLHVSDIKGGGAEKVLIQESFRL